MPINRIFPELTSFRSDQAHLQTVASDIDNTVEHAHAGFADLPFVGADEPYQFAEAYAP